ncbi:MAG: TolC family protein [Ilyomonas sp.]
MKKIIYTGLVVLFALTTQAQQVQTNDDLKSLINKSFGYFPQVKEAEQAIHSSQEKVDLAKMNPLSVAGDASYTYVKPKIVLPFPMGPNGEIENFQFAPVHNVDAAIDANYTLLDFGRIRANVERAKTDLKYATHNVENVREQLAYQVANIYYNVIYYKRAITIQDSVLSYLNENKRIINAQLQNGSALKIDILNIQAQIDAEQNRKVDLQNSLQKQLHLLAYTTGITQTEGTGFDFNVLLQNTDSALNIAQENNIDFVLAKDKVEQAEADLAITKLTQRPSVVLHGSSGYKNGYVPNVNEIRFNYNAGVTLRVPIYSGGKTKQQERLNESLIRQNQLAVETLSNNYKKDIEQALTDIKTNIERIENTGGQIEQARVAQQLATSRFMNGVGTNLEITNASTNLQRAEFTRLQYEYQLCLAKVQLAKLLGYKYW